MTQFKCCPQYVRKFGKISRDHRIGKGQFLFQSQIREMTKNVQTTAQLHSSTLFFWAPKSLQMVIAAMKLKDAYSLEKEMATHSSTLAWKIPWTEERGMLQSMGSQRVRHDWVTSFNHSLTTPWKESYDQPRQHIKKQRHHFANKGPFNQGYDFSSGHVWMWELDCEES